MKRKIWCLIIIMILPIMFLLSCNKNTEGNSKVIEEKSYTLICPDGLPAIAASKFIDESDKIDGLKLNSKIEKSTDLLLSDFMKGDADLAIVPSNLALQAYKKNLDYKVVGTIGWGSLYLVTMEDETSIEQLKGKEIYNTGKGLTPDIIFNNVLNKSGLTEKDVTLSYVGAASELAPMVLSGQAKYAVLPEPALSNVKGKNPNLKVICSLNDEWKKQNNSKNGYPQSTLLIKGSVYSEIKDTQLYADIIKKLQESEEKVIEDPNSVVSICKKLEITINPETVSSAISNSNLDFTPINKCKDEYIKYFDLINGEQKENYDSLFIKK